MVDALYIKNKHILSLLILVHILGMVFYYNFEQLRYVTYLIPIFSGGIFIFSLVLGANFYLSNTQFFFIKEYLGFYYFLIYIVIAQSLIAFIFNYPFHTRFLSEGLFLIFPLISITSLSYYFNPDNYDRYAKSIFFGAVVAFIFEKGLDNIFNLGQFDIVRNLIYSEFTGESGLAFIIGLFFFYFLFKRKIGLLLLSLLLIIISGKRAVLGASLISVIFYFAFRRFSKTGSRRSYAMGLIGVLINCAIIYLIFLFTEGVFNDWIFDHTGLPVNSLTNGRYNLWRLLIENFNVRLMGVGLGSSNDLLYRIHYSLENPLNDILKIFLEQGVLVFILWIFLFYYVNSKNIKNLTVAVYSNIIFLTTNVLIYFFFMFSFYLVQLGLLIAEEKNMKPVQKLIDE